MSSMLSAMQREYVHYFVVSIYANLDCLCSLFTQQGFSQGEGGRG